ncbi:MAG: hypothetical protein R6X20_14060 [Phycisphaerae bacterium]
MRHVFPASHAVLLGTVLAITAGCTSSPRPRGEVEAPPSLHERYRQQQEHAPAPTGRHDLPDLGEASGLSDYLAYAALNNPGLEAAFSRWKSAVERMPQVQALPDPRFNYRYYIREVETRVGPQRQAFGVAQRFPWFGTLDLAGGVAAEEARAAPSVCGRTKRCARRAVFRPTVWKESRFEGL